MAGPPVWGRDTTGEGLRLLKERLREYYRSNNVDSRIPLGRLTLRKIKAGRHPKLKAKAGQTRRLLTFTLALAAEFQVACGETGKHMYDALVCLHEICRLASARELSRTDMKNALNSP